jgi:hypothetical protein
LNNKLWKYLKINLLFQFLAFGGILFIAGCGDIQLEPELSPAATWSPTAQPTSRPANKLDADVNLGYLEPLTNVKISPTLIYVSTNTPIAGKTTPLVAARMTELPTLRIGEVDDDLLNDITADFLFIADGCLNLFDHRTTAKILFLSPTLENNQAETDIDGDCSSLNITKIVIDKRNKTAAMLVDKGITANGIEQYKICVFLIEFREPYTLIDNIPRPSDLDISPDGKWIAYIDSPQSGDIVILSTGQRDSGQSFTVCSGSGCNGKIWSPESKFLLWSDKSGIWLLNVLSGTQENIRSEIVKVSDQSGKVFELPVGYTPIAWSPSGRYVSVGIHPERSDIQWVGILDTKTGSMVEVPGTHSYPEDNAVHTWNNDGTLTTVQVRVENEEDFLETTTYEIVPTHTDLMIATGMNTFLIPEIIYGIDTSKSLSLRLYNLHQQASGAYNLMLFTNSLASNSWLVTLDDHEQFIKVFAEVPRDSLEALWSPDGKHAIITGQHGARLLCNDTQDKLYDLRAYLGDDLENIYWLSADVLLDQ